MKKSRDFVVFQIFFSECNFVMGIYTLHVFMLLAFRIYCRLVVFAFVVSQDAWQWDVSSTSIKCTSIQRSARLSISALIYISRGWSRVDPFFKIVHILVSVSVSTIRTFPVLVSILKLRLTFQSLLRLTFKSLDSVSRSVSLI